MTDEPLQPEPDDKDWTWVLERPCPDCGFDAATITGDDIPAALRDMTQHWIRVLGRDDVAVRPAPEVWSPLEYGCHVRDVCTLFGERVRLMLTDDDPQFANWDQDETALEQRYWQQVPAVVAGELATAGEHAAETFAGVLPEQWQRPGRRSNGSVFTVDTLGRYFVHDIVHHLHDVGG